MKRRMMLAASSAFVATAATAAPATPAAAAPAIVASEYTAHKGAVDLAVYRKRATTEDAPVLLLVHGSSFGGRTTFDLTVPGQSNYSMMDAFAGYGFDVWTFDCEGYGRSSRTSGNSDIASGVADIAAVTALIARETRRDRVHLFGESAGALRAGAFAMTTPERTDRLVLSAFTYTGSGAPTLAQRARDVEFYQTHNRRPANRELYRSVFTRDRPGTADPAVGDAIADAEAPYGGTVPTGTYLDMVTKLPLIDPAKVIAPVLIVRGEYDGIATESDCLTFIRLLPNRDRQYVSIPGASHSLGLGYNRARFWFAVNAFLSPPARTDHVL